MLKNKLLTYASILLMLLSCNIVQASKNTLIQPPVNSAQPLPPPTYTTIKPPKDFTQCHTTTGIWFKNIWVPAHKICISQKQQNATLQWEKAYWGCISVGADQSCEHWKWFPDHWSKV